MSIEQEEVKTEGGAAKRVHLRVKTIRKKERRVERNSEHLKSPLLLLPNFLDIQSRKLCAYPRQS